jgi:hypothetical protein
MINRFRGFRVFRQSQPKPTARIFAIATTFGVILCALLPYTLAASGAPSRYRGGLRNSVGRRALDAKQLETALACLRDKTGFLEMRFDEKGFLTLGDRTRFSGGSATARALLEAAVKMPHAVEMESHPHSPLVSFARLETPIIYQHFPTGRKIDIFPLQIDFTDLSKLRGDKLALMAFDLGFVILHELGHAALGLRDTAGDPEGLGECEALINRIRRELNLPERQTYLARVLKAPPLTPSQLSAKQAELIFARPVEKQGQLQIEKFSLRWEAASVGPIVDISTQSLARIRNSRQSATTAPGQ